MKWVGILAFRTGHKTAGEVLKDAGAECSEVIVAGIDRHLFQATAQCRLDLCGHNYPARRLPFLAG
jgi:hypothetical protein